MKKAIVTGSTQGIGKSIGQSLLENGYFVTFNYAHNEQAAQDLHMDLQEKFAGQYTIIRADLSEYDEAKEFAMACKKVNGGKIDVLVLNAAMTSREPFEKVTWEDWKKVMDTNLNVPFFLTQEFADSLKNQGSILFIGSMLGQYPHAVSTAYGVSKAGIQFLAKSLVKEFETRQVRVNCICPGFVETTWQKNKEEAHRRRIMDKIALHRFAEPREIADFALAVLENHYLNGEVLNIDGGYCYR